MEIETIMQTLQPFIAAAIVGLTYSWYKYRSNILDPTKQNPERFEWTTALSTTILSVFICVVFQFIGITLDSTGLDTQMGVFAGLATGTIEPGIKAAIRWVEEKTNTIETPIEE